jgi:2-oxoisovalerate dehydrogenase E1 component
LSTPINEQYNCEHIADKGIGYGMESHIIDGNNIVDVFTNVNAIANSMRSNPRPVLLEFKTFRMRGHEEASGTKYVSNDLLDAWEKKDPLINFQNFLIDEGILTESLVESIKSDFSREINKHLDIALAEEDIIPNITNELDDVFKLFDYKEIKKNEQVHELRFIDAISEGLKQSMGRHDNLVIMGQDIAEYGGVFKITEGFVELFGKKRVRNTPICESGIIETAMGLSIAGMKSVVEMQFADFITSGFNPVVNYLAKSHYRWGQNADVVLRMPCGGGMAAGPFHSQTNEAWFTKTPGLKVVYPAFPYDAKGLLATAINDPNPVLFFEHKGLYRNIRQEVPTNYYTLPFGKSALVREGTDVTIISYGAAVHWALDVLDENKEIKADVIDLRTLQPLDTETIYLSVKRTNRAIILHEDSLFGGIASDISALIMENCFQYLDAPVKRVASLDTPIPFVSQLEEQYLPKKRFETELKAILKY